MAWFEGQWLLGAVLHSSNEPSELSQRPCGHYDSTINIVMGIIIIIIVCVIFEVTMHVGDVGHSTPSIYQVWSLFVGLPSSKIWLIFGHGVKWCGDLDLWPFSSKWGHGHPFHGLQLAAPFHARLRVRHGTDGQTDDGHQCFMPRIYSGGT